MKIIGLFLLVQLFSVASAFGQSRVVINQSTNSVAFTQDNKLWGLEVNGEEIFSPQYKSVGYQNGLYILEDTNGKWNVANVVESYGDVEGRVIIEDWIKASGVKVASGQVLFENADGNKALIYDRKTWALVTATETTYDNMYKEVEAANAGKGTKIHGYETAAEESRRLWNTQPRVVTKNGKKAIMFQDIEVGTAVNVISLCKDFNAEDRWYFLIMNSKNNWGVGFVTKDNPSKILFSIAFDYVKIENANNGWQMLNCHLLDGTVELRWYDGSTTSQKSIPVSTVQK